MLVIIANDTPAAIRGMLKRWCLEPKSNVFVGSFNSRINKNIVEYIRSNSNDFPMLVIEDSNNCQGFEMTEYGNPKRRIKKICGLEFIVEKQQ